MTGKWFVHFVHWPEFPVFGFFMIHQGGIQMLPLAPYFFSLHMFFSGNGILYVFGGFLELS